jgi:hypothetical protein
MKTRNTVHQKVKALGYDMHRYNLYGTMEDRSASWERGNRTVYSIWNRMTKEQVLGHATLGQVKEWLDKTIALTMVF